MVEKESFAFVGEVVEDLKRIGEMKFVLKIDPAV